MLFPGSGECNPILVGLHGDTEIWLTLRVIQPLCMWASI